MTKADIVWKILSGLAKVPAASVGEGLAPSNIALCKYWGKRNKTLNLPVSDSLSISLGQYGAKTRMSRIEAQNDEVILNGQPVQTGSFYQRVVDFLNLFRFDNHMVYRVETQSEVPIAAGLASSACGFAAMVLALNDLFQWQLDTSKLSILARLGSGSASRSLWHGFVHWQQGLRDDGMDSFGLPINVQWPDLCVGLMLIDQSEKPIGSREAMERSVRTSPYFHAWPGLVEQAITQTLNALDTHNFDQLGQTAESNALAMHALMHTSVPPVCYHLPQTLVAMKKIWTLREQGLPVYFTQDAGPNLKLLYLKENAKQIQSQLDSIIQVEPFASH